MNQPVAEDDIIVGALVDETAPATEDAPEESADNDLEEPEDDEAEHDDAPGDDA